ncbi:MAG: hypothetical protein ACR2G5_17680 [Pyrinomonadaceae bacterium]
MTNVESAGSSWVNWNFNALLRDVGCELATYAAGFIADVVRVPRDRPMLADFEVFNHPSLA